MAQRHLADWFTKGTARDTYGPTTVLQAVFTRHSNFGNFWVASRIAPDPISFTGYDSTVIYNVYIVFFIISTQLAFLPFCVSKYVQVSPQA